MQPQSAWVSMCDPDVRKTFTTLAHARGSGAWDTSIRNLGMSPSADRRSIVFGSSGSSIAQPAGARVRSRSRKECTDADEAMDHLVRRVRGLLSEHAGARLAALSRSCPS